MINPDLDGIDHINIYSKAKTEIGKILSNFYNFGFNCKDGRFCSVEAYWYWLGINECVEKEQLRKVYGFEAKKLGEELKYHFGKRIEPDFERKILIAIWKKVQCHKNIFIETNKLLFEHYYNYGGKIINVKNKYLWMFEGIEKMRNYLLKNIIER